MCVRVCECVYVAVVIEEAESLKVLIDFLLPISRLYSHSHPPSMIVKHSSIFNANTTISQNITFLLGLFPNY